MSGEETLLAPLAVKSSVVGQVVVIEPEGDLDLDTVTALRSAFTDAFEGGYSDLVVVLDGLDFIDSSGLGVLVGALKRARARGGSVGLVCRSPFLTRTLKVTGLDRVFTVDESLDALVEPATSDTTGGRRLFGRPSSG
jgi:anti-sigma B factor antagonist